MERQEWLRWGPEAKPEQLSIRIHTSFALLSVYLIVHTKAAENLFKNKQTIKGGTELQQILQQRRKGY